MVEPASSPLSPDPESEPDPEPQAVRVSRAAVVPAASTPPRSFGIAMMSVSLAFLVVRGWCGGAVER
ncbi:hypothetical protein GCM10009757_47460 [Streptomyces cheonanensis]|uniref:Uncharacterized protein n=1 Tax=Streptomyces cheonanensis TaxID=312720 RepID=A0ABP5H587_9ACTN